MTSDLSEFEINPLADSETEERAKLAALRTAHEEATLPGSGAPLLKPTARKVDSSYQHYLFGSAGSTDRPVWSDSVKGRATIRLVSRGIFGSMAFALGGRYASRQLEGYSPQEFDHSKPLQWLAKGFDVTLGNAIKHTVKLGARLGHTPEEAARIAEKAVQFRQSLNGGLGRSYGGEVVNVTFDFAMASIGDAAARNFIEMLDPNTAKTWLVNDKGETAQKGEKSHIDFGKMVRGLGSTTWRILSKNQGEDWFAGIMYVYQMRAQRHLLSHAFNDRFKGHQVVFDNNLNGGVYKVNNAGQIVGDYQLPGAIDLHARFVGYNWYTLMFREGYDQIAAGFQRWKDDHFAIHPHVPEFMQHPLESTGWLARYMTKSLIKANLYMNPAVVPFWLFRSPQSKWRGGAIHPDAPNLNPENRLQVPNAFEPHNYDHYPTATTFDKFEKGFSQMLNPFGKISYKAGTYVNNWGNKIFRGPGVVNNFMGAVGSRQREELMRNYTNAAFSYTPYMFAKAETALRVDERPPNGDLGEMDKAIYGWMHDVSRLHLRDAWDKTKLIARLGTHFEHEPVRDGTPVPANPVMVAAIPRTAVLPEGRKRHDPVMLDAANDDFKKANDNRPLTHVERATGTHGQAPDSATTDTDAKDRHWAETVAGRSLGGQFVSGSPTHH